MLKFSGQNMQRIRLDLGLSQSGLAEASGIHKKQISAYECGRRAPGGDILGTLATALQCPVDDLFEDVRPPKAGRAK